MTRGQVEAAAGPVPQPGGVGDDLVEGRIDEAHELDLGHRAEPEAAIPIDAPTIPDSASGVSMTRSGPNLVEQPVRHAEDAAVTPDVLAEDDDPSDPAPSPGRGPG